MFLHPPPPNRNAQDLASLSDNASPTARMRQGELAIQVFNRLVSNFELTPKVNQLCSDLFKIAKKKGVGAAYLTNSLDYLESTGDDAAGMLADSLRRVVA